MCPEGHYVLHSVTTDHDVSDYTTMNNPSIVATTDRVGPLAGELLAGEAGDSGHAASRWVSQPGDCPTDRLSAVDRT